MDSKTLITALKKAVREVIKEELTEILRDGLQSTITEMKTPVKPVQKSKPIPKRKPVFEENRFASILNDTDPLIEQTPAGTSFSDLVNEGMDEIRMTSADARGFGMMRQNMQAAITGQPMTPSVMEDPETGKTYEVAPEVQQALTRDYSQLMKAINKKRG